MYDARIGRFHTQDRFAEKYLDFTPYQYGANNPIKFIDVNGDSISFSDALINNSNAYALIMHYLFNTDSGRDFFAKYGDEDGEFFSTKVEFDILKGAPGTHGQHYAYATDDKGKPQSLGTKEEIKGYSNATNKVSKDQRIIHKIKIKPAPRYNGHLIRPRRVMTIEHEKQHLELMQKDIMRDGTVDLDEKQHHSIMKKNKELKNMRAKVYIQCGGKARGKELIDEINAFDD
ncbi:hypothetical protein PEPS_45820 (plasmid) [Persicobacter psychrovividus]|uniref:RHS repeat-associated core domain-containing protein n=2 Tax=Persicobacter psychrovividus TaxID=387638 RepID=A0ABM7VMS1_9BACT|nr:hypothetical protein PEPS_45820 [Persicobacter psychrovividus]